MRPPQSTKEPLLFVNSTTGSAPSGRNVRVKARVQHALNHIPVNVCKAGHLGEFSVSTTSTAVTTKDRIEQLNHVKSPRKRQQQEHRQALICEPKLSATRAATVFDPSAVLALARFHISRVGIDMLQRRPDRMADMLRWRQWTRASFLPASPITESPCTHSAMACLTIKLEDILRSSQWGAGGHSPRSLTCYSRSLAELRGALCSSKAADVVAAAQLLAVFQMLDAPGDDTWAKHTTGAVALLMSSTTTGAVSEDVCRPILAEALLDGGQGAYAQAPRRALACRALPTCTQLQNDSLDAHIATLIEQTAELIDDWHHAARKSTLDFGSSFALLADAHKLRTELRNIALTARTREDTWLDGQGFDYLGFGLTCLVALDQMIRALRPEGPRPVEDVEEETYGICWQLLRTEMRCNEYEPRWAWR